MQLGAEFTELLKQGAVWCAQESTIPCSAPSLHSSSQQTGSLALLSSAPFDPVPFALPEIDQAFPHGGLARGAIHEWYLMQAGKERGHRRPAGSYIQPAGRRRSLSSYPDGQRRHVSSRVIPPCSRVVPPYSRVVPPCSRVVPPYSRVVPPCSRVVPPYSRVVPPCSLLALLAGNALRSCGVEGDAKYVIWVGRRSWPTPYLLRQTIQPISRCVFIDPPNDKLCAWAVETALRSSAVAAVIAELHNVSFIRSRRFSLAAEQGGGIGLFIKSQKDLLLPSTAASRWTLAPTPSPSLHPRFSLNVLRCKGGQPSRTQWTVEFTYGERYGALSLRVPSDVAVRTATQEVPADGSTYIKQYAQ